MKSEYFLVKVLDAFDCRVYNLYQRAPTISKAEENVFKNNSFVLGKKIPNCSWVEDVPENKLKAIYDEAWAENEAEAIESTIIKAEEICKRYSFLPSDKQIEQDIIDEIYLTKLENNL